MSIYENLLHIDKNFEKAIESDQELLLKFKEGLLNSFGIRYDFTKEESILEQNFIELDRNFKSLQEMAFVIVLVNELEFSSSKNASYDRFSARIFKKILETGSFFSKEEFDVILSAVTFLRTFETDAGQNLFSVEGETFHYGKISIKEAVLPPSMAEVIHKKANVYPPYVIALANRQLAQSLAVLPTPAENAKPERFGKFIVAKTPEMEQYGKKKFEEIDNANHCSPDWHAVKQKNVSPPFSFEKGWNENNQGRVLCQSFNPCHECFKIFQKQYYEFEESDLTVMSKQKEKTGDYLGNFNFTSCCRSCLLIFGEAYEKLKTSRTAEQLRDVYLRNDPKFDKNDEVQMGLLNKWSKRIFEKLTSSNRVGCLGSVCFKVDLSKSYVLYTWRICLSPKILGGFGVDHCAYLFPQLNVSDEKVEIRSFRSYEMETNAKKLVSGEGDSFARPFCKEPFYEKDMTLRVVGVEAVIEDWVSFYVRSLIVAERISAPNKRHQAAPGHARNDLDEE